MCTAFHGSFLLLAVPAVYYLYITQQFLPHTLFWGGGFLFSVTSAAFIRMSPASGMDNSYHYQSLKVYL